MKVHLFIAGTVAVALMAGSAIAHHSFAMFDPEKTITVSGVVKEFEWTNPHVWLHVLAADASGKPVEWSFEMQATAQASPGGWRPDTVKPGDKVMVEFHPLRDGSRGGELLAATVPDGRRLGSSATRPAPGR
jgi:hypothetical protein